MAPRIYYLFVVLCCFEVTSGRAMVRYGKQCNKEGRTCQNDDDCFCWDDGSLRCIKVPPPSGNTRAKCTQGNINEENEASGQNMFMTFPSTARSLPPTSHYIQNCERYQQQCFQNSDCACSYAEVICVGGSGVFSGLCLFEGEELPPWFRPALPMLPTARPTLNEARNCEKFGEQCADDSDCFCSLSDELRCLQNVPESEDGTSVCFVESLLLPSIETESPPTQSPETYSSTQAHPYPLPYQD